MASETISLNSLPEEILQKILSHFGPEELCLIISKVCVRWNALAKDVTMWKSLSYYCDVSSDISHIEEVLTTAPALNTLMIRQREDVADILEFLFHKHGDLRKLIIEECPFDEDSAGLFANIVDLYPELERMSLAYCETLTSADYSLVPRLKNLSELELLYCEELSGDTIRLIADSCQHLKKLSLLSVNKIDDDDVIHIINKLGKQLTALSLDGHGLSDVAFLYLNNCDRLKELEFIFCYKMTDRGLLEGIGTLHGLTYLRLTEGHNLTAQALCTFLHGPAMISIVLLNLSLCHNLDDEGLKGIATRCIYLEELSLRLCDCVTDAGIIMVIRHCNQLRLLDLRGIEYITGNGWMELVPSFVPHLRELCLLGCNVCQEYVEELKAAVPELTFFK